ncbi:MAG: permease-like cell division protein FtsX [Candidatus Desulfofervidaceae bacterium]|nr:permease-like cell division protein FtsX [Candidatus Desulfofervidaceae bacterium]
MSTYFLKKLWQNVRLTCLSQIVCLFVIALSLGTLGIFILFGLNISSFLQSWQQKIPIIIFFSDEQTALAYKGKLQKQTEVKAVTYVSSEEALNRLKQWLAQKSSLLEGLDKNPLLPSLEIAIKAQYQSPAFLKSFVKKIGETPGVKDIIYPSHLFFIASTGWRFLKILMGLIGLFLSISAIFIISNTIRLNFQKREEEVKIMRLLGATDLFIKFPFYLEGLLQGGLGSILGLLILRGLFQWYTANISTFQFKPNLLFFDLQKSLLFIGFGLFLGWLGSFVALRRG